MDLRLLLGSAPWSCTESLPRQVAPVPPHWAGLEGWEGPGCPGLVPSKVGSQRTLVFETGLALLARSVDLERSLKDGDLGPAPKVTPIGT